MNALRRCLAAGAALVLLAGTAAAAYTDNPDISRSQAVSAVSELGILEGYADGSFRPQGDLTRQETAKIFTYILAGDGFSPAAYEAQTFFSDVDGLWGEGYINYLAGLGFLSGDGSGAFHPQANVTARQMAKLLLVALGYDAQVFTGSQWGSMVDLLARENGLYADFSGDLSAQLSREDAALLIYNGLSAAMADGSGNTLRQHYFPQASTGDDGKPDSSKPDDSKPLYALVDYHDRVYYQENDETFYEYKVYFSDGTSSHIKTAADITEFGAYKMHKGMMEKVGGEGVIMELPDGVLVLDTDSDGTEDTTMALPADIFPVIIAENAEFSEGARVIYAKAADGGVTGLWVIG